MSRKNPVNAADFKAICEKMYFKTANLALRTPDKY